MLAQPLEVALRRLATGLEADAQNLERVEHTRHHAGSAAQHRDQLGTFFIGEVHVGTLPNARAGACDRIAALDRISPVRT